MTDPVFQVLKFLRKKGKQSPVNDLDAHMAKTALECGLCCKRVSLQGEWWRQEGLPLLGFLEDPHHPVPLIWTTAGKYECIIPQTVEKIDLELVKAKLLPYAYAFFATFPEKIKIKDIIKLSWKGNGKLLFQLIGLGILGAVFALFPPFVFKTLFDVVIPQAEYGLLIQILMGLLVAAISGFAFEIVRSLILLRLEGILQGRMTAALWDRMFRLFPGFFRQYATGDLIQRTALVEKMKSVAGGRTLQLIVTAFFGLFYLIPMFYYSAELAWIGLIFLALSSVIFAFFATYRLRIQRFMLESDARLNKFLIQMVQGIDKLRVSHAVDRAYTHWFNLFSTIQKTGFFYGRVENYVSTLSSFVSAAALFSVYATVFYMMRNAQEQPFSIGTFMAFNAAFTPLTQAVSGGLAALGSLLSLKPSWERGKVILDAPLENTTLQKIPDTILGDIKVEKLSFRYQTDLPWTLEDISLEIPQGKFVGIVGTSGCGKSTLLRLMLGLELMETGSIYFDKNSLREINKKSLREKVGAVLQNEGIFSGTIYENIVCGRAATVDQIQKAVQIACFDEVLTELPLSFDTPLPSGGATLSGGQKQRLLLTRALLLEPSILFLDEATSALDNNTQERIMNQIDRLQVTRLVVAHRLSTVEKADKIYVFDKGKLSDVGTYQELIKRPGLFQKLHQLQNLSS